MLKGKTIITMNRATIIAAVQMYLDDTFKEEHVVTDVRADTGNYQAGAPSFTIELDDGASAAKVE